MKVDRHHLARGQVVAGVAAARAGRSSCRPRSWPPPARRPAASVRRRGSRASGIPHLAPVDVARLVAPAGRRPATKNASVSDALDPRPPRARRGGRTARAASARLAHGVGRGHGVAPRRRTARSPARRSGRLHRRCAPVQARAHGAAARRPRPGSGAGSGTRQKLRTICQPRRCRQLVGRDLPAAVLRSGAPGARAARWLKPRSRMMTLASRLSDRLSGSRLLEPTVAHSSSITATLPCSGRSQYS